MNTTERIIARPERRNLRGSMRWIACCGAVLMVESDLRAQCEQARLTSILPHSGRGFGNGVALDGDVIVVGASRDHAPNGSQTGVAWVFRFNGDAWIRQQKLYPANLDQHSTFGFGMDIEGATIVIGDQNDDDMGAAAGAMYIFEHDGANWIETQKLLASNTNANARLGISLDLCGDTILAGASGDRDNGDFAGAAHLFRYDGASWVEHQKLLASDGEADDRFGLGICLDGDVAVIGAPYDDDRTGAAYVFTYDPESDEWIEEQKLVASDGEPEDDFGSPCLDGNTIVVGAPNDDNENGVDAGAVYVFNHDGSMWVEAQRLLAPDGFFEQEFGRNPTIEGDVLVVGADEDDFHGHRAGAAYLFRFNGREWILAEKIVTSDGDVDDSFGGPIAIQGPRLVISARGDSGDAGPGTAYVFELDDDPLVDCNNNLIDDGCEAEFADCDGNGVPDDCDIADGVLEDCNGDGVPDVCGEVGTFSSISPELSPIGFGSPQTYVFDSPPVALDEVELVFTALGDFHLWYERLAIELNGERIGEVFEEGPPPPDCQAKVDSITLTTTKFHSLVEAGDAHIRMTASHNVFALACEEDTYVQVELTYRAVVPITDCNNNGVMDSCDADFNSDGAVDTADLVLLLANWGCTDCVYDLDCDGAAGTSDLLFLLGNWR